MRSPKLLTVREAAKIVRVHPLSMYRLIREGKVPVIRFGRNIRVIEEELCTRRANGGESWQKVSETT